MTSRLIDLFYRDRASRMKMYATSAVSGITFGWASLLLGSSTQESLFASVCITAIIIGSWTAFYCSLWQNRAPVQESALATPRRVVLLAAVISIASVFGFELKDIEAAIISRRVKRLGDPKAMDKRAIESITSTIKYAKENDLPSDPKTIGDAGLSFLAISPRQPEAWEAAQAYLAYRTNFNSKLNAVKVAQELASTVVDPKLVQIQTRYDFTVADGYSAPRISVGGDVPNQRAVRSNIIGREDANLNLPRHDEVMLVDGGALIIDDYCYRHVVFRGTTLFYSGGPLLLEDVTFVRCNFVLARTPSAISLADSLLTNGTVNQFSAP